jgi:hypothetical protein
MDEDNLLHTAERSRQRGREPVRHRMRLSATVDGALAPFHNWIKSSRASENCGMPDRDKDAALT